MEVAIDWARAELIIGRLLAAFRKKEYPYEEDWALPQFFIPEAIRQDTLLFARFLFYCCHYMRGSIKSDMAIKRLVSLWHEHPEFFDPEHVCARLTASDLAPVLGRYLPYKIEEISKFWHENSCRLANRWGGDPRLLFEGVTTPEEMYARIANKSQGRRKDGFLGFQEKMASMLLYFLLDAGLMPSLSASPPVDFHLLRVMLATEVLTPDTRAYRKLRYEHAEPKGRQVLERYAREHDVPVVELGNALWMLSVVLCSRTPGNISSGRQKKVGGKKIYPKPQVVSWLNPQHRSAYLASCGRCPIESSCVWNVMSGDYYQTGSLNTRVRERPTDKELFPLFEDGLDAHHVPAKRRLRDETVYRPNAKDDHMFPGHDLGKRPPRLVPDIPPEDTS